MYIVLKVVLKAPGTCPYRPLTSAHDSIVFLVWQEVAVYHNNMCICLVARYLRSYDYMRSGMRETHRKRSC